MFFDFPPSTQVGLCLFRIPSVQLPIAQPALFPLNPRTLRLPRNGYAGRQVISYPLRSHEGFD